MLQCFQTLVVGASSYHIGIVLPRRIHVMIISRQARRFQLFRLLAIDHAQRDAGLHAKGSHALDHLLDVSEIGLAAAHVAPGGAHAEAGAAVLLCGAGGVEDGRDAGELSGVKAGGVAGGLGAVGAVFAAAAGFDVHEGAHLDGGGVVEAAVEGALAVRFLVYGSENT